MKFRTLWVAVLQTIKVGSFDTEMEAVQARARMRRNLAGIGSPQKDGQGAVRPERDTVGEEGPDPTPNPLPTWGSQVNLVHTASLANSVPRAARNHPSAVVTTAWKPPEAASQPLTVSQCLQAGPALVTPGS